jgi:hypothetical protein
MFGLGRSPLRILSQSSPFWQNWNSIEGEERERLDLANNCYSYAVGSLPAIIDTNNRSSEISAPQPGDASGTPKHVLGLVQHKSLPFWIRLAERDGLKRINVLGEALLPTLPRGYRLAAMVYSPKRHDYHWLRQEPDGLWSHKRGRHDPIAHDFSRQLIADPRRADLGDYDAPPLFFVVPQHGIEVRMKREWLTVFHQFDDYLKGDMNPLRDQSWNLANLIRDEIPQLSNHINELAANGSDADILQLWRCLADGAMQATPPYMQEVKIKAPAKP